MKLDPSIILLPLLALCFSCDPPNIFLIQNASSSSLKVDVSTRYPITQDSIRFTDTEIKREDIRLARLSKLLNQSTLIHQIDSQQYSFKIAPQQTFMLTPASIGVPWTKVIVWQNDQAIEILSSDVQVQENILFQRKFPSTTLVRIQDPLESNPHP